MAFCCFLSFSPFWSGEMSTIRFCQRIRSNRYTKGYNIIIQFNSQQRCDYSLTPTKKKKIFPVLKTKSVMKMRIKMAGSIAPRIFDKSQRLYNNHKRTRERNSDFYWSRFSSECLVRHRDANVIFVIPVCLQFGFLARMLKNL